MIGGAAGGPLVRAEMRKLRREERKVARLMCRLKTELERLVEEGVKRDMEAASK